MQKVKATLVLAGALSAVFVAPEASAIPAFARQVGMACSACHYQHYPVLTAFGRAFKQSGYTLIGAQTKVESDTLSLPSNINAAVIGNISYVKTNGAPTAAVTDTNGNTVTNYGNMSSNDGAISIPSGVSLFLGGRGGEHFGFEAETSLAGNGTSSGVNLIRFKVPFVADMGEVKGEAIPFSTANGVADSFEILNTGAVNVHAFNQADMPAVSAQQYIGTGTTASGVALVTSNEHFFVNLAKWGADAGDGANGGAAMTSTYARVALTTDLIPGFDSAIGFQSWSGSSVSDTAKTITTAPASFTLDVNNIPTAYTPATTSTVRSLVDTKAFAVDAQMMGDVGGMPLLLVASYAKAPASPASGGNQNLFNTNTLDKSSFNIGAELGVVPNVATVQLAYRKGLSGIDAGTVGGSTGSNATDNAVMIGLTYAVALNARLEATYSMYSGDLYTTAANPSMGTTRTQFDLAFAF